MRRHALLGVKEQLPWDLLVAESFILCLPVPFLISIE